MEERSHHDVILNYGVIISGELSLKAFPLPELDTGFGQGLGDDIPDSFTQVAVEIGRVDPLVGAEIAQDLIELVGRGLELVNVGMIRLVVEIKSGLINCILGIMELF
jgi:hypothetical protein